MLGTVGRRQWSEAAGGAPLPANHSSAYAPEPRATLITGIAALTTAVLAHLGDLIRRLSAP